MSNLADVGHVSQVSVAPVFLLSGIGAVLSVLVARLGRIIDRGRTLEDGMQAALVERKDRDQSELVTLARRSKLIERAIILSTAAGFLVCLVIILLFVDYLIGFNISVPVALSFLVAMLCLMVAFIQILREVVLATAPLLRDARR